MLHHALHGETEQGVFTFHRLLRVQKSRLDLASQLFLMLKEGKNVYLVYKAIFL